MADELVVKVKLVEPNKVRIDFFRVTLPVTKARYGSAKYGSSRYS